MQNMPKNIINKIMFFTTHPVAEIMKEAPIFEYMKIRLDPAKTGDGSPYAQAVSRLLRDSYSNRDEEFDYCEEDYRENVSREDHDCEDAEIIAIPATEYYLTFYHGQRRPYTERSRRHYQKLGLQVDWKIQRKRPYKPKVIEHRDSDSESDSD